MSDKTRKLPVGKENGTYYSVFGENSVPIATPTTPPVVKKNPIYQMQEFDEKSYLDQIKSTMFNTGREKKDQRRFNRYMRSKQGQAALDRARTAHRASEQSKLSQALAKEGEAMWLEKTKKQPTFQVPTIKNIPSKPMPSIPVMEPVITPKKGKTDDEWLQIAKQYNFNSLDEVKNWQRANNLRLIDGKFGKESLAKYNELKATQAAQTQQKQVTPTKVTPKAYYTDEIGNYFTYDNNRLTQITPDKARGLVHKGLLRDMKEFKNAVDFQKKIVNFGGLLFENPYYLEDAFRTTNNAPDWNQAGSGEGAMVRVNGLEGVYPLRVWNDRSFAIDTKNKKAYELEEDWLGEVDGRGNDKVLGTYNLYSFFNKDPREQTRIRNQKFGGTMNKINYFQQGGAAPKKQDMQQQLIALVQAAMQGDQKATNAINQILEAAKSGDQQAMQIAQMIQQIAKQMQGQATAAKWGAKLNYVRSLKYANGGKTCTACQAGAPIKKVEEKACGGKATKAKKVKKRYFGGWL